MKSVWYWHYSAIAYYVLQMNIITWLQTGEKKMKQPWTEKLQKSAGVKKES
jgi:hypothetical protein